TLSKMTSQLVGLLPKKLILEVNGLDGGKFRIVQLPSMSMCEGGTGLTLPSIKPPKSATQPSDSGTCARAGVAVNSDTKQANSRIPIHLWPTFIRILPLQVMFALVPISSNLSPGGTEAVHDVDWIPAVPPS